MFKGKNEISEAFFRDHSVENTQTGCWEWSGYIQSSGYGQFKIRNKPFLTHRVVWEFFNLSAVPAKTYVCHSCGNRACINPEHLFIAAAETALPAFQRQKRIRKLTDDQVREIRNSIHSTITLKVLAERYKVSMACISTIRRGKRKQLVV